MLEEIFFGRCPVCGEGCSINWPLCQNCREELRIFNVFCGSCGYPLAEEGAFCPKCSGKICPVVDKIYALYRYSGPMRKLLLDIKFRYNLRSCLTLGRIIVPPRFEKEYDAVFSVPSHILRRPRRFFHPADILAKLVAENLSTKLEKGLKRGRHTGFQYKLSSKERTANVKNAFSCGFEYDYKNVLLVDDILTTGSTVNECAKALKAAGVRSVDCFVLAKG